MAKPGFINSNRIMSTLSRMDGGILVTGGTGFLGAYIIKNLIEKGNSVRAIRRSPKLPFFIPKTILDKVEWVEGDILDFHSLSDAMQGIDRIIHTAAIVSFSKKNRSEMYQTNIEGTANVVNAALENNVKRLLHVSSVAALGRTTKQEMIDESKKWEENKNNTHYAKTKHYAEMHVWRGFAEGLTGAVINPSTILGFGDWHQSSCAIFRNVYKGFPWYTKGINGFVGVEDVAEAAVQVLASDISEKKYIVNAENMSFRDLFNTIADHLHKKRPDKEATKTMGEIAWRMEKVRSAFTGKPAMLTKETAKVAHSKTTFDNHALLRDLPDFTYTPLATIIKNACEQYINAMGTGTLSL
jgi:dihydroflavonol-4-reductase